jgi:hypothetical protein
MPENIKTGGVGIQHLTTTPSDSHSWRTNNIETLCHCITVHDFKKNYSF